MQNRAMEAWNKETLHGSPRPSGGRHRAEGLQEVDDQFRTAYAEVLQHLPPKLDFGVDTMTDSAVWSRSTAPFWVPMPGTP